MTLLSIYFSLSLSHSLSFHGSHLFFLQNLSGAPRRQLPEIAIGFMHKIISRVDEGGFFPDTLDRNRCFHIKAPGRTKHHPPK